MSRFYVAALAGRSGSGKSFASEYLASRGVPVVDGDDVSREVTRPGEPCLAALVREFSPQILRPDGTLDRRLFGSICFSDAEKKRRLDEITHPFIIERMTQHFDELRAQGHPYCLVEAPALLESGLYAICARAVLITAGEERLLARIMERDGLTEQEARNRLGGQTPDSEVAKLCDVVIENNGTQQEFRAKLDVLKTQLDNWFIQ